MIGKMIKSILASFFLLLSFGDANADNWQYYYDDAHGISIRYPAGWYLSNNILLPITILKISTSLGNEIGTCSINLQDVPGLRDISANEYFSVARVKKVRDDIWAGNAQSIPDYEMLDYGIMEVSGQNAFWAISSFSVSAQGAKIETKSFAVFTNRGSDFFTISCNTLPEWFNDKLQVFRKIARSVRFE